MKILWFVIKLVLLYVVAFMAGAVIGRVGVKLLFKNGV